MICSRSEWQKILLKIRSILNTRGYPKHIINYNFILKFKQLNDKPVYKTKKYRVYLYALWIKAVLTRVEKQTTMAIKRRYFVFESNILILQPGISYQLKKGSASSHNCNNVIYQFKCHCDSRYIGYTSQCLQNGI